MRLRHILLGLILLIGTGTLNAKPEDSGYIQGRIYDEATNEPIPFANLIIYGTNIGSVSDLDGRFIFAGVTPGYVRIQASSVGFESYLTGEFLVTNANRAYVEVPLRVTALKIDEIVVKASPFRKTEESPVSLRRIGIEQIEKNPGGNRDISKVIQSFPGVASTPAFRNDVVVRGGGPSENRFLLDGIEIPNLNHFATQGASGGPVGIINVDLIREVNFYSGAFPANIANTTSSVLDMRQVDGNKDRLKFRGSVGASDMALTLDGPISENTTFIGSVRRSYLQFLFAALELPFLPTYNDYQFKLKTKINEKNELSIISLGALDQFALNLEANETADQRYILSYLPVNEQWNYTIGAVWKHYKDNGYSTWVISRNYLNNTAYKYLDNREDLYKTYDYASNEIENKFRYERTLLPGNGLKISYGLSSEYAKYDNYTKSLIYARGELQDFEYNSFLDMFHYGIFSQLSKTLWDNRWNLSAGIRADGTNYSSAMDNPFKNLSPRVSSALTISPKITWNTNVGRYQQRPAYTLMGYQDASGNRVNQRSGLKYIVSNHIVSGFEYQPSDNSRITVEAFYKHYTDYPFSIKDSIALASKGADFGVFGNEEVQSSSEGRAYGTELLARWQDLYGFSTVISYTWVRSEFKDQRAAFAGQYLPTTWDNRHLFNVTATRTFKNNIYVGFKWRYVGGAPYTPYDAELSSIRAAWDAQSGPYLDYTRFNQSRTKAFHQLDVRVDKQWYFSKWSLNLYLDIQNLYNFKADEPDRLIRSSFLDPSQNDVYVDDNNIERYELQKLVSEGAGTVLPTIGVIVEF